MNSGLPMNLNSCKVCVYCYYSNLSLIKAENRADNGPENLAILRRLTLNVLRTARPKPAISRK